MRVLVAHPGTQHSFRLAVELNRHQALSDFYTGLAFLEGGTTDALSKMLPNQLQRRISNRRVAGLTSDRLHCRPFGELMALWRLRNTEHKCDVFHQRNSRFQRSIPKRAFVGASAVIGFDTAAWILANRCAEGAIPFILDQTTPHYAAKLSSIERMRREFPEWRDEMEERPAVVRDAEEIEHREAATIVTASSYSRQSLIDCGVPASRILVNPYGVDCTRFPKRPTMRTGVFRFIYVGGINAHKGVPLLIKAWRQLEANNAELWLVGPASRTTAALLPQLPGLRYMGVVPHREVPGLLQQCNVLVFPSYFEGFGLVILEAMACGLPVIATTASAGPDVITAGHDGWTIEPGNQEELMERMRYCFNHRDIVQEMGYRAHATANRLTWTAYGDRWMQILATVCG